MNRQGYSTIDVLLLIGMILGIYGALAYFLINTDKITTETLISNIKFVYFLLALLFGAVIVLYVVLLNKNKGGRKKK